jgi:hypothetical protein
MPWSGSSGRPHGPCSSSPLAIIPLLVLPLVLDLSESTEAMLFALDWFIWAVFAVECGIRLYLAPVKGRLVRSNIIDLIVIFVPFLRPLRVARSARMLRLLRAARVGPSRSGASTTAGPSSNIARPGRTMSSSSRSSTSMRA